MALPRIELKNVSLSFGKLRVHRDISFTVSKGESVILLGPSGVGKTLILKIIAGLLRPTSGQVLIDGTQIQDLKESELRLARTDIGMLFQGAALFDSMTSFENIAYPLIERQEKSEAEMRDRVEYTMEIVGLPGIGHKYPSELSGGQKKRIGLARALASEPKIMLFDEPTTGLDPTATRLIDELIIKLHEELEITCVSVTHDITSARRISDRWLLVHNGSIAADGDPRTIAQDSTLVADFINGNWTNELHCLG